MALIDPTGRNINKTLPQDETQILTPYNISSEQEFLAYILNDIKQLVRGYEVLTTSWTKIVTRFNIVGRNQIILDQRLSFIESFLKEKFGYEKPELNIPELNQQTKDVLEQEEIENKQPIFTPNPNKETE